RAIRSVKVVRPTATSVALHLVRRVAGTGATGIRVALTHAAPTRLGRLRSPAFPMRHRASWTRTPNARAALWTYRRRRGASAAPSPAGAPVGVRGAVASPAVRM